MPPRSHRFPSSQLVKLHNEVVRFSRFLLPTDQEREARDLAIARICGCIAEIWPGSSSEVFGSFATGLYLPTSDVDLVIFHAGGVKGPGGVQAALRALATKLARNHLATDIQVIAKARVPIVKFQEQASGFNFDVSFDQASGPQAAGYVRELVSTLPQIRPLLLVLKTFLSQRECNEVYTGGIGSYGLLCMLASFLLSHPSRRTKAGLEGCLGTLLIDFFMHYGRLLNTQTVGVSCLRGGGFFLKRFRGLDQPDRPYLLCIEDPQDTSNDLGKNSFAFVRVSHVRGLSAP